MLLEPANLSAPSPVASSYRHLSASVARDDGLNVRAQPDPDAPVAGAIPPDGTDIEIAGQSMGSNQIQRYYKNA